MSKDVGNGEAPTPARRYASWRASTVRMLAEATSSIGSSVRSSAPPRYAPMPTEVIMLARSTKEVGEL